MKKTLFVLLFIFSPALTAVACAGGEGKYTWAEVTKRAAFPEGYNFPVFVFNGGMFALHDDGWFSKDGKSWKKTGLPKSGLNSAYQKYVHFRGGIYALGTMRGNYMNMNLTTRISRTKDLETWETLAERSNLPERVFYGAAVFRDRIWLIGANRNNGLASGVLVSEDGSKWEERTAPWTPRGATAAWIYEGKLFMTGGKYSYVRGSETVFVYSNDVWAMSKKSE